MERLGIGRDDRIVVYDNSPIRTAARGWFMLRHFGAEQVAILDGGLQKWMAEGRPTESGEPAPRPARFEAVENARRGRRQAARSSPARHAPLLDARGKARFEGSEPDPAPGVAAGHIPGARNLPFAALYKEDGTLQAAATRSRRPFAVAGADPHAAVRRHLRLGRHRQFADLRRASARQRGDAALRRKLERMGRRSGDARRRLGRA